MTLSNQHRAYLNDHAVTDETIESTGIYSEGDVICFPWDDGCGTGTVQRKLYKPGEKTGYLWEAGKPLHPWVLRENDADDPLLIVEGTKQALAAASWAPEEYAVYGMAGCRGLSRYSLEFAEDRDVFVILDADAATNPDVYDAGEKLALRLKDEDAKVKFVRLPVEEKDGLDDYLASIRPGKRTARLARRIAEAVAKPADRKPTTVGKARKDTADMPDTGGREMVAVNGDLKQVVDNIVGALKARWDGHHLFNYGRVLTCVEGPSTLPLEKGQFLKLLADTVMLVTHHPATQRAPERFQPGGRMDGQSLEAVMASSREFAELRRVVRSPFVRADGTVCSVAGYDEPTRTVLVDDPDEPILGKLSVPEAPSESDVNAARDLLMNEWLGDLPFPTPGDRANALALVLTPFIRGLVPLVPMAVVNGLQMGVGKNLFADVVAIVATGKVAVPMPYTRDDDETRKQITAAFRSGMELFAFDEAHEIEGASLARALTSITYTDRVLGVSNMAEFPNTVTWMSMGNQTKVNGDCSRRVYWIELRPAGANPQDRDANSFRHPDLRGWTRQNRARLVSAALTLIRAWFADGQPVARRGTSLGSFEQWDRMVGGIVTYAGLEGFLGEIRIKRSETDFDGAYWTAHIAWLRETFGPEEFTTAQVRTKAMSDPLGFEAPPRMDDVSNKGYTRELGKAYAAKDGRWFDGLRLVKSGMGHRSTLKWRVEAQEDGGMEVTEVTPPPTRMEKNTSIAVSGDACVRAYKGGGEPPSVPSIPPVVAFDLETRSAPELWTHSDFVRIGKVGPHPVTSSPNDVVEQLESAERITGHGILDFDLLALAQWHGGDYEALAAKSLDTMLVSLQLDPIGARGTQPAGFHGLDALAQRLGVPGKTDDIRRLAKEHGGFENIPLDDPEYVSYLEGDVETSQGVGEALLEAADADPYIAREHAVQAIMGRITLEGFRVDTGLLEERYQAGQDKLNGIKNRLESRYGFPNDSAAPHRTKPGKAALYEALRASGLGPRWLEENWPKNQDGTLSQKKEVLQSMVETLSGPKPDAAEICDAILQMNGVRTIYGNIRDNLVGDRVHPSIFPWQSSGRWSVTDPGITVMGKRGGKHVERAVYLPDEGDVLVCFDADQVDMRCVAALSQDKAYMELFEPGRDVHSEIAAIVGLTREESKPIGHGWNYGESINKMVAQGVRREAAEKFDTQMKNNFPVLCNWQDLTREEAGALPYGERAPEDDKYRILVNGFGRRMRVERERAYTQACALMGQGTTRDIMAEGLLRLPFEIRRRVRAVIHDEIVVSLPADCWQDYAGVILEKMSFDFRGVPITWGSSKPGTDWSLCYAK